MKQKEVNIYDKGANEGEKEKTIITLKQKIIEYEKEINNLKQELSNMNSGGRR